MNKPQKQTVYLPVDGKDCDFIVKGYDDSYENDVKRENGYFFTPEQLNEYTQSVIKQALETAAENAKINYKEDGEITKVKSKKLDIDYLSEVSANVSFNINKQSITNTFEETYKKFEV